MKKIIIIMLLLLMIIGCSSPTKSTSAGGNYICNLYNAENELITNGWILLDISDNDKISGNWRFNSSQLLSSGELVGYKNDSLYSINLHPDFVDNNIFINFELKGDKLNGNWCYSTFIGATDNGKITGFKFYGD